MARPIRPEPKWFLDPGTIDREAQARHLRLFHDIAASHLGEKSTSYIEHPEVASRILETYPHARFLVLLREPVARALSNYRFSVENGIEELPLDNALTPEAEDRLYDPQLFSVSPFAYLKRGRYIEYLQPWLKEVSSEQLFVVIFEELVSRGETFEEVCSFLGVKASGQRKPARVVNASIEPMPAVSNQLRSRLEKYFAPVNARLELLLGRRLLTWR